VSRWLHMSRSVKDASGHTHGGEIWPVFGALLTSTLMRVCVLDLFRACVLACVCARLAAIVKQKSLSCSRPPKTFPPPPVFKD
jgi:hypothetical protein